MLGALRAAADVVNLGFVVNLIEAPQERADTLRRAWGLARNLMIVAARMTGEERDLVHSMPMSDGIATSRNTFQKFYEQQELKHWIEQVLGVDAFAAAPGIYYVFRYRNRRGLWQPPGLPGDRAAIDNIVGVALPTLSRTRPTLGRLLQ